MNPTAAIDLTRASKDPLGPGLQVASLLLLGIPVAGMAWTVTHEEAFREPRPCCQKESAQAGSFVLGKFFYLFTCEYCFRHDVAAGVLLRIRLTAAVYGLAGILCCLLRSRLDGQPVQEHLQPTALDIKHEQVEIKADEQNIDDREAA